MKFGKKLERLLLAEMGVCLIVLLLSMSGRCSSMAILLSTLFQIFMIIYIIADKVFFVPAAVYRGTDDVVPSFQPMGNLFEQCLLILFDIIIMTIVDETPGLTFEKMSKNHRNVE